MSSSSVAVTRYAVHIPGRRWPDLKPGADAACAAEEAHRVLGRKGLLGKDQATRLALCAAHRVFGLPPGLLAEPLPGSDRTAVVVASNLGNVSTVCEVVDTVRSEAARGVSPMAAPNASSNIIASSLAIRYGFKGPNLMLCSGATCGTDAVQAGARLIRAGRADRVLVVGVEPDDAAARGIAATASVPGPSLTAAAAALVLEAAGGGEAEFLLEDFARGPDPKSVTSAADMCLAAHPGAPGVDLAAWLGSPYGAFGVLQVAVAVALLQGERVAGVRANAGASRVVATAGCPDDGYAAVAVRRRSGAVVSAGELVDAG